MDVEGYMSYAREVLGVGYNALHTMEVEEYGHYF